jgi:hypothetical protein
MTKEKEIKASLQGVTGGIIKTNKDKQIFEY